MEVPRRVKDVQRLNGCVTALGHFISRLGEWALPFFKLLKKSGPIDWTPEAKAALQDLKRYLTSPPVLVAPKLGEPLLLYVVATSQVVSAVLVVEREEDDPRVIADGPGLMTDPGASSELSGALATRACTEPTTGAPPPLASRMPGTTADDLRSPMSARLCSLCWLLSRGKQAMGGTPSSSPRGIANVELGLAACPPKTPPSTN
ncbi:hypothetical protein ACQ4PT_047320 [Festuca glaucescens]